MVKRGEGQDIGGEGRRGEERRGEKGVSAGQGRAEQRKLSVRHDSNFCFFALPGIQVLLRSILSARRYCQSLNYIAGIVVTLFDDEEVN